MSDPSEVRHHESDRRDADDVVDLRDRTGTPRDGVGEDRDQAGEERDQASVLRDDAADERDRVAEAFESMQGVRTPASHRSARARRDAAADRKQASEDRASAHADRDASARERNDASVDALTGVSCRGAGFLALEREIARSRRDGHGLLVGFIDVDRLKAINDANGHAAGDQVLAEVAAALRANLRAYDLIFRYGGDEFVCAMSAVDIEFGTSRIALVNRSLAESPAMASITAGFAELRPEESTAELVGRADAVLYRVRQVG